MNYAVYGKKNYKSKRRRFKKLIISGSVIILLGILLVWVFVGKKEEPTNQTPVVSQNKTDDKPNTNKQTQLPNLQPIVDKFIASHPGIYAVKITDEQGNKLAEVNGDKSFYSASIYKLFVAYAGYQKIDDGTFSLDDPYLSGYSRGKCLDAMIRDSYSPCAEKMWQELGKEELTVQMKNFGLTNTSLVSLTATANDTVIILQKIASGHGLSESSKKAFLDSMKTQDAKYRRGLPAGFSDLTVYNKVGWNLDQEWHDTAIVELANGQKVIVSVLTTGAGYKNIAQLGTELEKALQ